MQTKQNSAKSRKNVLQTSKKALSIFLALALAFWAVPGVAFGDD